MRYLSEKASRIRLREAQRARENRAEIIKARSHGEITRRDLYRWGIFGVTGALALKNGLSPFARSAFADSNVPTGTPPSPLFGAKKFTQPLPRLAVQTPIPIIRTPVDSNPNNDVAVWSGLPKEPPGKRLSYHTDFTANPTDPQFINRLTGRGPIEGRAPGEIFAHQRWSEFFPKVGYVRYLSEKASRIRLREAQCARENRAEIIKARSHGEITRRDLLGKMS
jgi:hypothetical protein